MFAQATWLNFSAGRFAGGLHGVGDVLQHGYLGMGGEIGYTYRTAYDEAHPGGHGLHQCPQSLRCLSPRCSCPR